MSNYIKTYIGKKGYTIPLEDLKEEQVLKIQNDLTFKPFRAPGYGPDITPSFSVFGISKKKIFLPKFYGIENFGKTDDIRINNYEKINISFNGSLRDNQLTPVDCCLKASDEIGGGILCAGCGSGKTAMMLYIIAKKGVKALVIVNKEFLMDQWKERIEQFLPDARVGILRQKTIDIENKDIVIAMLQSVSMCDYDISIYKSFGLVVYDEVHCVPSKIFSKALRKINTKYHFGLSATPNRSDGMTKVTKLYIGPIIYKANTNKLKNPKNLHVFSISFKKLPDNKFYKDLCNYKGKPDVVKMISNIVQCPKRIALISMLLRHFIIKDKRHILVLSERIQYLHDIKDKILNDLNNNIPFKIGYYIGGMKKSERKESESADLILASYSMAKEAMDIPILDTLLMATSKSNIEQSVGRILRKTEYSKECPPLVIDMIDKFSSFYNQSFKRIDFYKKKHYPITSFIFDENDVTKFYSDINNGIKNIIENKDTNLYNTDNTEPCIDKDDTVYIKSNTNTPKLIQTKIDNNLYNMIGDGEFDI